MVKDFWRQILLCKRTHNYVRLMKRVPEAESKPPRLSDLLKDLSSCRLTELMQVRRERGNIVLFLGDCPEGIAYVRWRKVAEVITGG